MRSRIFHFFFCLLDFEPCEYIAFSKQEVQFKTENAIPSGLAVLELDPTAASAHEQGRMWAGIDCTVAWTHRRRKLPECPFAGSG